MRRVLAILALCLALPGLCQAGVLVSPVLVEAHAVEAGDEIVLSCTELTGRERLLTLSLGLFDQDAEGRVILQEDEHAQALAADIVELPFREFRLLPHENRDITLRVRSADFASAYVVVFVRAAQAAVASRLAVLLMLSTGAAKDDLSLADLHIDGSSLALTFHNRGDRHGTASGMISAYDSAGDLQGEFFVESGRVLPNRQRRTYLALPTQPHSVRFTPLEDLGGQFWVSDALW